MNYYQYRQREPRQKATDFIKPFLVIILFAAIIVAGWRLVGPMLFGGEKEALSTEKVFLDIATGGAKAKASGSSEWTNVPSNMYLYEEEGIKTQSDGRATLTFFEKNLLRMDKSTQLKLDSLSRTADGNHAVITLEDGKIWVNIKSSGAESADFVVNTGLLTVESSGGIFALGYPGMLYVLEGSVKADVLSSGSIVKSATVGIGQELILDEQIASDLAEGLSKEIIFALDDAFKTSNWYRWNQQQEGVSETSEESTETEESDSDLAPIEETDSEAESTSNESADGSALETPQIKEPGENGDTVTLDNVEQIISGTVSQDAEGVIVNDYRLTKYVPGSGKFSYSAKVAYDNLKVGDNEFEVFAVDKDGNKSKAAKITLVLPQDVYDKSKEEDQNTETSDAPAESSTGGVKITAPNGGANLVTSETEFVISGEVPAGTAKVVVNDYTLLGFKVGDTTFKYNAKSTLGTLEIGKLNTYTVKAYDADDKLIGTASMTINVESSETGGGDPIITMPSSSPTYSTTLDQLVVGGTIGKWVELIYINGEKLTSYIPGSESWRKTVTLTSGQNVFSIYGEKGGEKTGTAVITITLQN